MCMGGGSTGTTAATVQAATPAVVTEEVVQDIGIDSAEKKRKAQQGKRDLRVNVGELPADTVGAGITSGINVS